MKHLYEQSQETEREEVEEKAVDRKLYGDRYENR